MFKKRVKPYFGGILLNRIHLFDSLTFKNPFFIFFLAAEVSGIKESQYVRLNSY